jgi:hypothetical protein
MREGSYPEFTDESVDRILAFLPEFERGDFKAADEHYRRTGEYLPQVDRFATEVYVSGFILPFDWLTWKRDEAQSALTPESLARADMTSLRKALTAFLRQDRFSGGFLAGVCSNGLTQRILERLRDLQAEARRPA